MDFNNLKTMEQIMLEDYNYVVFYSPKILENIRTSEEQSEYRKVLSEFRGLTEEALEEAHMFYLSDTNYEIDYIISNDRVKEVLGIKDGNFITQQLRFVFPILDERKIIQGFIGYDYDQPKYKYLINIATFGDKTKLLYNKQHIKKAYETGIMLVEEGIADTINLNSMNVKNNVSLMGSYMTEHHARVLNRMDLVVLIPDNDEPGQRAVKSWSHILDTKKVIINIKKRPITKKYVDENGEVKEVQTTTKDLDDVLRLNDSYKKDFLKLYNLILSEKDNPFIDKKVYNF